MAYFLKKCTKNDKCYLSIVNSFYDGQRGHTVHETYKSYGTGESLIKDGIEDPVKYLEEEVARLNYEKNQSNVIEISETAPFKFAGHFYIKAILEKLEIKPIIDVYKLVTNFQFDLYDVLCSLVYSRCIKPCSKYKTFIEVIPYLEKEYSFSYDQLL
ncbi:MAG: transposase, partial [Solobacterium sp.]|nr:transposase [Solobacterium sp.]